MTTRICPTTGIVEVADELGFWLPARDEDGHITRICPDNGTIETMDELGFWLPRRD